MNSVLRVDKHPMTYAAFSGRTLTRDGVVELY